MCKLIIFRCFFLVFWQQDKYKLIRRNVCTVVAINNISRILAQNVKKSFPCDFKLLSELKFIFVTTLSKNHDRNPPLTVASEL